MAVVGSSNKLFIKDNVLVIAKGKREQHVTCDAINPSIHRNLQKIGTGLTWSHGGNQYTSLRKVKSCVIVKALSNIEKHLKCLDTYLGKIQDVAKPPFAKTSSSRVESIGQRKAENSLRSVEKYLVKMKDAEPENDMDGNMKRSSARKNEESGRQRSLNTYMDLKTEDADGYLSADNISDFYLIALLASMNIAVFLFEIATPVKNSNFELFSLPLIYGAKINNLILTGEWWRLVTPMFLHSGIFHIAIGIWILFTFGRQVSRQYGMFTFLLIYVLGGISGNLISYLHTPEPTVGGTGPAFALIGAWLIYQLQNKDVIARDSTEKMFQKAVIITALSFLLTNFSPIDDWTHFAATMSGIAYGYMTCPSLQMKDASSEEAGRQERIALVRRYANPCKSLLYFTLFLCLLSSLLYVFEPPLDLIE